jgi:hypothetical protein
MKQQIPESNDNMDINLGDTKRVYESSNSGKDQVQRTPHKSLEGELQLALVDPTPEGWTKVKNKKGKKGRIEDYLNS